MKLKLIFPEELHENMWQDIIEEIEMAGEKMVPHALSMGLKDYHIYLQKTRDFHEGRNLGVFVPATTYFLMDERENEILGAISIRHSLNEDLFLRGGHIGYGIRPSQRRKGYATKMLNMALDKCREMGLEKVLVTCNKDNIGSSGTIINNNGVLENEVIEDSGNTVQRYWIQLREVANNE